MKKKKSSSRTLFLVAGVIALAAAGAWASKDTLLGSSAELAIEGAEVERGPLRISVIEKGNLKAAESETLKSEIEGQTTVLFLIDEGTVVQPGDLLCELDVSDLEDKRVEQEIRVQNREAEYVKAQKSYEIQESQNKSDIATAERELEFAQIDLEKYVQGEMPQELQKADEDILVSDEKLQRAIQDLEWSEKLAEQGFLEQTVLDADRLAKTTAEVVLNQAMRAKVLLEEYTIPRTRKELEAEVEEKIRELERVKLQAEARITDYDAEKSTSKARLDLERAELTRIDEQMSKAVMKAPVAGMVVYSVENHGRWGGGEPMQEGAMVRERQEIITIPSEEGYIAETSLHESVLEKVVTGMPCIVTVDAVAGRTFAAEVKFKALLPDQQSWFANPDLRVYKTEIKILDGDSRIRPGMSCSVEILVDELEEALHVPVQAIFLDAGKPVCFVSDSGSIEKRSVEVGQNNGKQVEVKSGLEEAEVVLLSQPVGFSLEPVGDKRAEGENPWEGRERPTPSAGAPTADAGGRHGGNPRAGGGGGEHAQHGASDVVAQPAEASVQSEGDQGAMGDWSQRMQQNPDAAERMRKWAEENPEEAKRIREAMQDPEKRKKMMEQWRQGGARTGGPGRSSESNP